MLWVKETRSASYVPAHVGTGPTHSEPLSERTCRRWCDIKRCPLESGIVYVIGGVRGRGLVPVRP